MDEDVDNISSLVLVMPDNIVRVGLEFVFKDAGFSVVSVFSNLNSITKICIKEPELILISQEIIEQANKNKIEKLFRETNSTVIILKSPNMSGDALSEIGTNVRGYLSLSEPKDIFIRQLKILASGCVVVSGSIIDEVTTFSMTSTDDIYKNLSEREKEVLISVARGNTNDQVAEDLFISEYTVKVHLRNIINKLNLNNRQQAIAHAWKNGIVPRD